MSADLTSIIIINFNTRELTARLLQSIQTYCRDSRHEIILVDNGSADGSQDLFRSSYPGLKLLANKTNLGFARAANQGAHAAQGEYLWFLNSDCLLIQPLIEALQEILAREPRAAIVTPKTVDEHGNFFSVCRKFPTYRNIIFSRGSLLSRLPFFRKFAESYTLPDADQVMAVAAVAGTAMFIRRRDFNEIGGFDERFFLYFEDTDLCLRLWQAGKNCYYAPHLSLVHKHLGSSQNNRLKSLFYHHLSAFEYFLKWEQHRWAENLGLFFLLTINLLFRIMLNYVGLPRDHNS